MDTAHRLSCRCAHAYITDKFEEYHSLLIAENNGTNIHYGVESTSPPLVFLRTALAMRGETWRLGGYVERLNRDYKLILIDVRGHGQSDKPHVTESYRAEERAGDVTAVLDHLGVEQTHFLGVSMGGGIGFYLALIAPNRIVSLIIGAAAVVPSNPDALAISPQLIEGLADAALERDYPAEESRKKHAGYLRENDSEALNAVRIANSKRDFSTLRTAVTDLSQPVMFYADTEDPIHDAAQQLATDCTEGRFISLVGLNHVRSFFEVDRVMPAITRSLTEVAPS